MRIKVLSALFPCVSKLGGRCFIHGAEMNGKEGFRSSQREVSGAEAASLVNPVNQGLDECYEPLGRAVIEPGDAENSASVHQCLIESWRQSFGGSRKE